MTPVSSFLMQATFAHVESQRALKCWIINHKCNFKIIFSFFTSLALPAAENSDLGASKGGLSHLRVIFFKGLCSAVVWDVSFACLLLSPFL